MANYKDVSDGKEERQLSDPEGSKTVEMTFTPAELEDLTRFLNEGREIDQGLSRDNISALVRRAVGNQIFISDAQQRGDVFFVKTRGWMGRAAYRRVNFL